MKEKKLIIYTDGGSRNNPGLAAYGYVIKDMTNNILFQKGGIIGIATNNVAEYTAVLEAFNYLKNTRKELADEVKVYMDSQLLQRQLSGVYKIKNIPLQKLARVIKTLEKEISKQVEYTHIKREFNKEADFLVNQALDSYLK